MALVRDLLEIARSVRRTLRVSDSSHPIARPLSAGTLDEVRVRRNGCIQLLGRAREMPALEVEVDGAKARLLFSYRPQAASLVRPGDAPFCIEFAAGGAEIGSVTVRERGEPIAQVAAGFRVEPPHYANLLDEERVLHRDQIYGYGPPNPFADPAVIDLSSHLPGPVLDVGCGSGALVRALRERGLEAHGIELDRPEIATSLRDDVKPWITLYDGSRRMPFADGQFASVVCTEVLEHIPDYAAAVAEMARLARREALITVPDMSAIPRLFPHNVVPWHLLEATHLNFFTQRSLAALLAPHFPQVRFGRIGAFMVNGTEVFTSLVALCSKVSAG
jgi:SAM-dependent methyltransferase